MFMPRMMQFSGTLLADWLTSAVADVEVSVVTTIVISDSSINEKDIAGRTILSVRSCSHLLARWFVD